MIITRMEEEKARVKIYLDQVYGFSLLQKEVQEYQLREGSELSEKLYEELIGKVVVPRAKQKAVDLLKYMDRCEQELRQKLKDLGFPGEAIQEAIDYVNHYGYLNDERFAIAYIRSRMNRKSKLVIRLELQQKGVESSLLQTVINQVYSEEGEEEEREDPEFIAIRNAIRKKTSCPEELSVEEKQKLMASLYRKGFDISKVKKIIP